MVLLLLGLAGCSKGPTDSDGDGLSDIREGELGTDPHQRDTDHDGLDDGVDPAPLVAREAGSIATFLLSDTGVSGPEPSVGITSSGCIFFMALEKVMRSCNHGASWDNSASPVQAPVTSGAYLWVDPVTDRIFDIQAVQTQGTWIAWSDDDGATWLANPLDFGTVPDIDHLKLATGPWTPAGFGQLATLTKNVYSQAAYVCHDTPITGTAMGSVHCYTSFDGGMTFPVGATAIGTVEQAGGPHGAISPAPDGTIYLPPRTAVPEVAVSHDNGFSWSTVQLGQDVGTPDPRTNPEVGTDTASNAYSTWIGKDSGVYLSRSTDGGATWDAKSLRVSPATLISATFPQIQAGDPGRVAIAYLGSNDASSLNQRNIDNQPWDGNPHYAPENVTYDLYVSFSLDALDAAPTWHTVKLTTDPVQVGSICLNAGDCRTDPAGTTNRNLLDFNDLSLDRDGRVYIAFADGCRNECAKDSTPEAHDSRDARGMVAIQQTGPSLYAAKGNLTAFT